MTVSENENIVYNWNGDNVTTTFDFDFFIEEESQLIVMYTDENGIQSTLQKDIDYSIAEIGNTNGSFIIYPLEDSGHEVLKENEIISLVLNLPIIQDTPYTESEKLVKSRLERNFDYLTRLIAIQDRKLQRSIKIQESVDINPDLLVNTITQVAQNLPIINAVNENKENIINILENESFKIISEDINKENSDIKTVAQNIEELKKITESAEECQQYLADCEQKVQDCETLIAQAKEYVDTIDRINSNEIGDIGIAPLGIDETKGKRRYLNGQILIQERYKAFTNKLKNSVALYPSLACTEEEWQTISTMSVGGQCGKFVIDDEAGTIRLPKIIMPIQGLTDLSKLAEIVEAGLPNITASAHMSHGNPTTSALRDAGGAFVVSNPATTIPQSGSGTASSYRNLDFDASLSNTTYGNSDTVQQEQIQYPYFIQVATGAETVDNITNELELINPYVLLEPKYFETEVYNLSWLRANGSFNGSSAVHPSIYNALLIELNADIEVGTTQNNYSKRGLPVKLATDSYTDYDFVLNTADETFRLPVKVKLASGKAVVGNGMALGLTDGTNNFSIASDSYTINPSEGYGANVGSSIAYFNALSKGTVLGITTDLTKSGIETSDSGLYLYFYVGETVQNANLINAGRIEEIKANRTEIEPLKTSYITETYVNGSSWYRIYSDGWCEQGGMSDAVKVNSQSGNGRTVTFLKTFRDTNYSAVATGHATQSDSGRCAGCVQKPLSVNSMSLGFQNFNTSAAQNIRVIWSASGYLAEGEY